MNKLLKTRTYLAKWMLWTEEQLDWAVLCVIVLFVSYIVYVVVGG